MTGGKVSMIHWRDVPAALGLLTRLPMPVDPEKAAQRGAAAAWAYPLAGAFIGVILAASVALLLWVGLPGAIVAVLVIAVSTIITGAMHEDGLADTADGLWGGWEKARRLEIMKDSRIGVYGVLALALSLLLRWLALIAVIASGHYWAILICLGMLSRTAMVGVMAALPNARADGLSQAVGRPGIAVAVVAAISAIAVALFTGLGGLIPVTCAVALICGAIAKNKIGGQTGDILGATQQVCEIALLLTLVSQFNQGVA